MKRGLPRPINSQGLPVPYIALDPDHLGQTDDARKVEVPRNWLCQVCGLAVGDPAFAIVRTVSEAGWPLEWVLDHGLLHDACLRVALANCPALRPWQGLRLLLVSREDATLNHANQLAIPLESQIALEVSVAPYLDQTG